MSEGSNDSWLATVVATMPLGAVIHAADGSIIAANPAACAILGYTAAELAGCTAQDPRWQAVDGSGRALAAEEHPALVALRTGREVQRRLLGVAAARTGGQRWLLVSAHPESLPGAATPHRVCVLFEDITARREAEALRSEAEDRFRALFEQSPIGIAHHRMLYDAAGAAVDYLFLEVNPNYLRLTGVDPRGRRVTEAFPGIERDPFGWIGRFDRVVRTGEPMRVSQYLALNDRWYDLVGYRTGPECFVAAFLEITEQKRAEQALRASEEQLRITLESIGDAVISTDAEGRILRLNRMAETLTGWPQAEAQGRPLPEVFRIINALNRIACENPVERVLATGAMVGLANHTVLIHRQGGERQIADSGAPIRNDAGAVVGVVLVFRDVTEEYALQEQLIQSRKLDALGQLAGGVAHDFNNMLASIMSAGELVRLRLDDRGKCERLLDIIHSAAERAADLTRKLLTFARKGRTPTMPVRVHEAIRGAVALLEHSIDKRVAISLGLDAEHDLVEGDLAELQNVFLNLGINANQAMPAGGALAFRSRELALALGDAQLSAFSLVPGPYLEVVIRDTGAGISPQHLPRIFDPFFTTKAPGQGTGLGLTTAYGTIRQHRGAIGVASELGCGTTFTVLLPLASAGTVPAGAGPAAAVDRGSGRILLIDDEPLIRATARMILEGLGYEVVEASDGAEGVRIYAADPEGFLAVIVDMIMPVMDGRTCCERLCAISPGVRILLSSGYTQEEDLATLRQLGVCTLLRKPYRESALAAAVAEVVRGGAG